MELSILYSFRRCPYAMRARLALQRADIKSELREVVLRDRPEHMMEISPKGTVPVMLLQDGTLLEESLDIMDYAAEKIDSKCWKKENTSPISATFLADSLLFRRQRHQLPCSIQVQQVTDDILHACVSRTCSFNDVPAVSCPVGSQNVRAEKTVPCHAKKESESNIRPENARSQLAPDMEMEYWLGFEDVGGSMWARACACTFSIWPQTSHTF